MSFGQAVSSVFRQYVGFTGRARRSEYWFYYLFIVLVTFIPYIIAVALVGVAGATGGETNDVSPATAAVAFALFGFVGLFSLATFLPTLAVQVRRLHDTGRSGFWYFISFVPFVGGIILLVFSVMDSTPGPNVHGPNPKQAAAGAGYGADTGGYGSGPYGG